MTAVKICGVTRPADAAAAVRGGADLLGLNFWPESRRHVDLDTACAVADIARAAGPAKLVGVFVNQDLELVQEIAGRVGLDWVQLHGDENPAQCASFAGRCIKAIPLAGADAVGCAAQYPCDIVLVDTPSVGYGGSGVTGDWQLARAVVATGRRVLLAGGLTPDNVAAAVLAVVPWGVDVAGGVESSPGAKDHDAMRRFIAAAKGLS